ncbi:MAG: AI-2E family transporter [Synechococcaceae cyanobacterium SM2_3_1]|nr:AI-2E family transporter [Synechococcaceae cyanobacterium SM2_3_1]
MVFILTILLLLDPLAYTRVFTQIFPCFYRPRIAFILQQCEVTLRSWLVGILLTSVMVTLLSAMGLLILRVPYVLANAVLAGMLNFIPNIGPTLSVVAPMAAALTVSAWKAIFVLILYILIQQLESTVLTPVVMSRQVSLLPGLTLMAQVVFATFFGVLGLLLAVPLAAVLQIWIREALIRDILDPWTTPRALAPHIFPESHPLSPSAEAYQDRSVCPSGQEDSHGDPPPCT